MKTYTKLAINFLIFWVCVGVIAFTPLFLIIYFLKQLAKLINYLIKGGKNEQQEKQFVPGGFKIKVPEPGQAVNCEISVKAMEPSGSRPIHAL